MFVACISGGLKLWEGSVDLVNSLCSEVQGGRLSLLGKRVLEVCIFPELLEWPLECCQIPAADAPF